MATDKMLNSKQLLFATFQNKNINNTFVTYISTLMLRPTYF